MTVFGAGGNAGRRVVTEALSRDHDVTAVVRDPGDYPDLAAVAGDAANPDDVARLTEGQDVAVLATRPAPGREPEAAIVMKAVLAGIAPGVRLLVIGGSGSLTAPGGGLVIDSPEFPPSWLPIARASGGQFDACRAETTVDWTYISPANEFEPGVRTGKYRLGKDDLLVDADGRSAISMEDFAVALVDEAERPRHKQTRFTVGY
ncbi:NAD(P)-dependent oxidoreductase [Actinosynnema sp. ALI-1.44]|uniref:NAD(P)-dependent oxidoreductase n=1 Tax=Actinosynnema sp. ALI-1.44 TaxID=1933779 RepID=UPI001EDA8641|nr:NAD(P)H-binding protein [Actinosynnema sp. ALI-1.44]